MSLKYHDVNVNIVCINPWRSFIGGYQRLNVSEWEKVREDFFVYLVGEQNVKKSNGKTVLTRFTKVMSTSLWTMVHSIPRRDVERHFGGIATKMIDCSICTIRFQTTQVIEDTRVIITPVNPEGQQQSSSVSSGFVSNMLNPSPDTCIDSLFNLNTESSLLVDVPVTTIAETPLLFATTLFTTHSSHHTSATIHLV
ncbi:hypothetical protein Tco_0247706 [Tanacetum coccineum]